MLSCTLPSVEALNVLQVSVDGTSPTPLPRAQAPLALEGGAEPAAIQDGAPDAEYDALATLEGSEAVATDGLGGDDELELFIDPAGTHDLSVFESHQIMHAINTSTSTWA